MPPTPSALLTLALLLSTLVACRGGTSAETPSHATAESAESAAGQSTYTMACVRCHGPDGRGGGELGAKLAVPSLRTARVAAMPTAEIEVLIRDGRGAMPPHANRLPPAQITAVTAYVQRLARETP